MDRVVAEYFIFNLMELKVISLSVYYKEKKTKKENC